MVDAEQRLVLFNQRFLEMYGLSTDVARVGMPMADLIRHSAERGNFPIAQLEEIKRRRLDMMARGKPFRLLRQMSKGRTGTGAGSSITAIRSPTPTCSAAEQQAEDDRRGRARESLHEPRQQRVVQLPVVRHGAAAQHRMPGGDDGQRPLL